MEERGARVSTGRGEIVVAMEPRVEGGSPELGKLQLGQAWG